MMCLSHTRFIYVYIRKHDPFFIISANKFFKVEKSTPISGPLDIDLQPMQIRTFEVTLADGFLRKTADPFTTFS